MSYIIRQAFDKLGVYISVRSTWNEFDCHVDTIGLDGIE
jgi:hypothetical protein